MSETQSQLYSRAGNEFAPAIARLARAMERDADKARDLEQDIHCAIWRSLENFAGDCSLKTWVFRVAHNTVADHVRAAKRQPIIAELDEAAEMTAAGSGERAMAEEHALTRLHQLIRALPIVDAQMLLLWLEGHSTQEIAEIAGFSPSATGTRIHRLREKLTAKFQSTPPGEAS